MCIRDSYHGGMRASIIVEEESDYKDWFNKNTKTEVYLWRYQLIHKILKDSLQPKGWLRYFSFSLDHKVIGIQYLVCGFLFYLIGGTLASAIRIELASPISDFMPRDVYNQVLTLHGTIMIFLWIVPVVNGAFGNYLIPFYVGARDMAFPRLNACLLYTSPSPRD